MHKNITLSLSNEMIHQLRLFVKRGKISQFVEEAIADKLKAHNTLLEQQYRAAGLDDERNAIFAESDHLAGEGLDHQNNW